MIFKLSEPTLSSEEKLTIVENLSIMSSSGIPIVEALEAIKQDLQKSPSKEVLGAISKKIQEGFSLAEALEKFPNIFDKVFVSTVRSGEASGNLDQSLKELSIIITKYKFVFFILLFISLFLIFSTFKNKKTRGFVINLFNNLPIIKPLILKIDLIRFTRTFSILLGSGVPIIEACELSSEVISQNNLRKVAVSLRNDLSAGKTLSDALKSHKGFFPGVLAGMVSTGEKSGNLDKTLIDFSNHLQDKVSLQVKNIATLIEPILLILVGIAVGAIIIAIIAPIYQLIGQISPQ